MFTRKSKKKWFLGYSKYPFICGAVCWVFVAFRPTESGSFCITAGSEDRFHNTLGQFFINQVIVICVVLLISKLALSNRAELVKFWLVSDNKTHFLLIGTCIFICISSLVFFYSSLSNYPIKGVSLRIWGCQDGLSPHCLSGWTCFPCLIPHFYFGLLMSCCHDNNKKIFLDSWFQAFSFICDVPTLIILKCVRIIDCRKVN